MPITSILFLVETIYSNTCRCNYLRNEKYLLIFFFFFAFSKFTFNVEYFLKKMTLIANVFYNLGTPKYEVR